MRRGFILTPFILALAIVVCGYVGYEYYKPTKQNLNVGAPVARYERELTPVSDSTQYLGTTSPSTIAWRGLIVDEICFTGDSCETAWPLGGGGGSGGTWSTTTSGVTGQLFNYPNNNDDIVTIGSNSSTTAEFYYDPNIQSLFVKSASSTIAGVLDVVGNFKLPLLSQGLLYNGSGGLTNSVGTTTLTASSPLSLSQPVVKVGGSNSVLTIDTSGTWSGNAGTASALAANGGNCSAGSFPLGVDASGAVESCTDAWTEAENTAAAYAAQATTITIAGTSNQITSSAGAQSLAANRTWTLSFPNQVIFPQYASTTLGFSTPYASSTSWFGGGLTSCSNGTTEKLLYNSTTGQFSCGTDQNTGGGTSAYEIATTSDIALSQLAYIAKTAGRTTLASVATTTLSCSGGTNCSQAVVIGSSPITVSSFAFPYTANAWGNSTTTTIGLLNGFLSTASSTIVGNATTTGGQYVGSLYGASLTACNSTTQKLLWTADGQFTCGTDAGAGGGMTSFTAGEGLLGGTITDGGTVYSQVGTSTLPTVSQIPYWTSLGSATAPAKLGSVATSSVTINAPLTSAGTPGYVIGGSGWTLDVDDIGAADLASADFGSFTCNGTTCSLDSNSVVTTNITGGSTNTVLQTNGADIVAWAKLDLANQVTGILPIANGGTATTTGRYGGLYFFGGDVFRQASTTGLLDYDPTRQLFTTKYSSSTDYASFLTASSTFANIGTLSMSSLANSFPYFNSSGTAVATTSPVFYERMFSNWASTTPNHNSTIYASGATSTLKIYLPRAVNFTAIGGSIRTGTSLLCEIGNGTASSTRILTTTAGQTSDSVTLAGEVTVACGSGSGNPDDANFTAYGLFSL